MEIHGNRDQSIHGNRWKATASEILKWKREEKRKKEEFTFKKTKIKNFNFLSKVTGACKI